jgi:hypothetical protein
MNGEMFKAYVEQFLSPTLKKDDVVFMDNISVHKVAGIEEAIEARGAIPFYLPAHSPDLNPTSNYSLHPRRSSAKLPRILSRTPHSPSGASARPSSRVSIKSLKLNALHNSRTQDIVHLNGNRSERA